MFRRPFHHLLAVPLAAAALAAPTTAGAAGLVNPGFESDLSGWTASRVDAGGTATAAPCEAQTGICSVAGDVFTAQLALSGYGYEYEYGYGGGVAPTRPYSVQPVEGARMARLAGPFTNPEQGQAPVAYQLEQTFVVDAAAPVLYLNYQFFSYDFSPSDRLTIEVSTVGTGARVISRRQQTAAGTGVVLKSSGWERASVNLAGWEGQTLRLVIRAEGTPADTLYPFWAYVDAGVAPAPDAGPVAVESDLMLTGEMDPNSAQTWFRGNPAGCVPVQTTVGLTPAFGAPSAVKLVFDAPSAGISRYPMTSPVPGSFEATLPCFATGGLSVAYDVIEPSVVSHWTASLGGFAAVAPIGRVYDLAKYAKHVDKLGPERAKQVSAVAGATVLLLRREPDAAFRPVLSGDPALLPQLNSQATGARGHFAWSGLAGDYRMRVSRKGYVTLLSPITTAPIEGFDLGLTPTKTTSTLRSSPCRGLSSRARTLCRSNRRLARRLARCERRSTARSRNACVRRARRAARR